jgi:hypothetical protein
LVRSRITVQVGRPAARHSPSQPPKKEEKGKWVAAVAVRVTTLPWGKGSSQSGVAPGMFVQFIPATLLTTVPNPPPQVRTLSAGSRARAGEEIATAIVATTPARSRNDPRFLSPLEVIT